MVRSWPDGSTESKWTLYRNHSDVTDNRDKDLNQNVFFNVLNSIWDTYQTELANDLGVPASDLKQGQITQITLTPYKISSNDSMHIDCTISATGIACTAKFYVEPAGDVGYQQVFGKNYSSSQLVTEPNATELNSYKTNNRHSVAINADGIPETRDVHGVRYTFAGWYPEDGTTGKPNLNAKVPFAYSLTTEDMKRGEVNFYARYVPDQTVDGPDAPYITVEKKIVGLPSNKVDKLLENFRVNVGRFELTCSSNSSNSYDFTIDDEDDGKTTILRWKINNAAPDSYLVTEKDYTVNGYTLKPEDMVGNNTTFDVEKATFTASAAVIRSNSSQDFKVGEDGNNQYWVFVVSLTSNGKNVVISSRPLSAGERASIVAAVKNDINGTISNKSTLDNSIFYSITQGKELVLNEGGVYKITYSDYNEKVHGPGIHIEHTNNWNMAATVNYSMADAKSADIKLTNKYTLNTTNVTITKKTTGAFADRAKAFEFTVSGLNTDATLEGTTVTGNNSFTLANGQSVTIKNLEVGKTITITENATDSKDYNTTADGHAKVSAGHTKSFQYEVCLDATSGEIYLKPVNGTTEKITAVSTDTDKKLSITVTNDFDGTPDTGVLLDTLPYLILLAVAVAGGVLVVVRKRKHRDE